MTIFNVTRCLIGRKVLGKFGIKLICAEILHFKDFLEGLPAGVICARTLWNLLWIWSDRSGPGSKTVYVKIATRIEDKFRVFLRNAAFQECLIGDFPTLIISVCLLFFHTLHVWRLLDGHIDSSLTLPTWFLVALWGTWYFDPSISVTLTFDPMTLKKYTVLGTD